MTKTEIWKPIPNFEGYAISSQGQVMNRRTGRILKQYIDQSGYAKVYLYQEKVGYTKRVHRMMGEAFMKELIPENMRYLWRDFSKVQIYHFDGIKSHNQLSNLRWKPIGNIC